MQNNLIIPIDLYQGSKGKNLDFEAICFYAATGFFGENDTFWTDRKWNHLNFDQQPWEYKPREITLEKAVDEFAELFHNIVKDQVGNSKVILPLSGGLDSRSLAVAMKNLGLIPYTYSYQFKGSFNETKYGRLIAETYGWDYKDFEIQPGYLWDTIEESARTNGCYSEFTHARQVAVADELSKKGDVWLLGHWGDVLFDDMHVDENLSHEDQIEILYTKILKKGGLELATDLWKSWNLKGNFEEYLKSRLDSMLSKIDIKNVNARIRAFKSLYWATRWTSTNLHHFGKFKPMALPYYDDRMCRFIMSLPEELLAGRQIQIEYIKKYAPELAEIEWQEKSPKNLMNFKEESKVRDFVFKVKRKLKHFGKEHLLNQKLIQRNWEIQFLGPNNDVQLKNWLFENEEFLKIIDRDLIHKYYELFETKNQVYWSHPLSMLLTLSLFSLNNQLQTKD